MPKVEYFGQNIIFICVGDIVVLEIFLVMLYMVMTGIRIVMIILIGCMMLMRRILMIISLGSIRQELGLSDARGGEIPHKWFLVRWIGSDVPCFIDKKDGLYCRMFH